MQFDKYATDYEHTVENRCNAGTPDECIEMIEKHAEIGVTGLLCGFSRAPAMQGEVEESIKLFGDKVISYFNDT